VHLIKAGAQRKTGVLNTYHYLLARPFCGAPGEAGASATKNPFLLAGANAARNPFYRFVVDRMAEN